LDLAKVVGRVVCTMKNDSLHGRTLLLVQPVDARGAATGKPLVAIDAVGAGAGETVFFVTGREASFAFLPDHVPADATIVGIVDSVDLLAGEMRSQGAGKVQRPESSGTGPSAQIGGAKPRRAVVGG
jgi:microcompartment protein CcmK/EutM